MSKTTTIADCKIIDLRKYRAPQGTITPIEGGGISRLKLNAYFTSMMYLVEKVVEPMLILKINSF